MDNIMKLVNEKLEVTWAARKILPESYDKSREQQAERNRFKKNQIEKLLSQLRKPVEAENTTNPTEKINENKKDMTEFRSKTDTEYKCAKCDKKFISVSSLNIHIKSFMKIRN